MATVPSRVPVRDNGYPSACKEPRIETDWHRDNMAALIEMLDAWYGGRAYVSGHILVYYERGNKRRRLSPDVWLARGVENYPRPNYLVWEEARGPEVVIELTSSRT